jgi:hypothetical protein
MSHEIFEVAEAETVTAVEGHMRGTAIARFLYSVPRDNQDENPYCAHRLTGFVPECLIRCLT